MYGFVVDARDFDHTAHPFFSRWNDQIARFPFRSYRNVRHLRAAAAQRKRDLRRGVPPAGFTEELAQLAESVKPIKASELRRRARTSLKKFGYKKADGVGDHWCMWNGYEFRVHLDFGGRYAQLRYSVTPADMCHSSGRFCFEKALGMDFGDWGYIVEENVDDAFLLFQDLIEYAVKLPGRIKEAAADKQVGFNSLLPSPCSRLFLSLPPKLFDEGQPSLHQ
jgi:hypothetical protein